MKGKWFGIDLHLQWNRLSWSYVDQSRGYDVKVYKSWGSPWPALQIEVEHALFFSSEAVVIVHNGNVFADTSDRRPDQISVRKLTSTPLAAEGQRRIEYHVYHADGLAPSVLTPQLEALAKTVGSPPAPIYVNGALWRGQTN